MRISEISRNDLRNLNKGPEVDSRYDDQSPEMDDIRKRSTYAGSKGKGRGSVGHKDISDKDLYGIHPVNSKKAKGMSGDFKEFAEEFFKKAKEFGYSPEVVVDGYGYNLVVHTANGVEVSIAGNAGKNLPNLFRPYIRQTGNDENLKNKKEELYSALREVYKLPATAFTENGSEFYMDGGKPSLPMKGSKEQRLENFFKVMPHIENMGNVKGSNRGSSAKSLVSRVSTPVRYYLGAASLIYIATRFGLPHLVPRGGGDSESTFDIKRDFITVGITEAGYNDYENGREPYYEHAVPCNVIQKVAIDMVKSNKNEKLVDEQLILEIAKMIKRNLMVIRTGHEESVELDKTHKQTMPDGWDPLNGDPLQRFVDAGVKVYPISGGKRLRENYLK